METHQPDMTENEMKLQRVAGRTWEGNGFGYANGSWRVGNVNIIGTRNGYIVKRDGEERGRFCDTFESAKAVGIAAASDQDMKLPRGALV